MREIYLVRHGQTDWNRDQIVMGNQDIPLNDLGRRQAELTAKRLATVRPRKIYTSDLSRAVETATIIARPHQIEPDQERELREINLKGYEGGPAAVMRSEFPHAYKIMGDEDQAKISRPYPETETRLDLFMRIAKRFDQIWAESKGARFFIVCHGGVIRCIVNHVMQMQSNIQSQIFYSAGVACDNCSISVLEADEYGKPYFRVINDVSHLEMIREHQ